MKLKGQVGQRVGAMTTDPIDNHFGEAGNLYGI